jgi:hypothetical protein
MVPFFKFNERRMICLGTRTVRASVVFKQRNLLSPMEQDLHRDSRGPANAEVFVQLNFVNDLIAREED